MDVSIIIKIGVYKSTITSISNFNNKQVTINLNYG